MLLFWKRLFEYGVFTNPVTGPAVSLNMDLIRTSYMASHTEEQIGRVIDIFEQAGRDMGLIPEPVEQVMPRRLGEASG